MTKKNKTQKKEAQEREMALKSLPPSLRQTLTEEEVELFLHSEHWPEDLCKKLEEFLTKL